MQISLTTLDRSANSSPLTSSPDESVTNSTGNKINQPETASVDSLDIPEFDSGTFILKPKPIATHSDLQQNNSSEAENFDAGTCVRVPNEKEIPNTHAQTYRNVVRGFQEDQKESARSNKASDINTTINRGNKI